jgi:hypothetical protein
VHRTGSGRETISDENLRREVELLTVKIKIIEIEWVDSCGFGPSWEKKDSLEPLYPSSVRSTGFLVEKTRQHITIAQSISSDQLAGRLCIPNGCIKRVKKLS